MVPGAIHFPHPKHPQTFISSVTIACVLGGTWLLPFFPQIAKSKWLSEESPTWTSQTNQEKSMSHSEACPRKCSDCNFGKKYTNHFKSQKALGVWRRFRFTRFANNPPTLLAPWHEQRRPRSHCRSPHLSGRPNRYLLSDEGFWNPKSENGDVWTAYGWSMGVLMFLYLGFLCCIFSDQLCRVSASLR